MRRLCGLVESLVVESGTMGKGASPNGRMRREDALSGYIVHRALPRVRKVKSQRLQKAEKEKSRRSRVKKRMVYNRRYASPTKNATYAYCVYKFVNAATLPGHKQRMCEFLSLNDPLHPPIHDSKARS